MWLQNYKLKLKKLELSFQEKQLALEYDLLNYKDTIQEKMAQLENQCAIDTASYEHVYHSAMQEKQSKLAELDSLIKVRTEIAESDKIVYERIIKIKDDTIDSLNNTITNLVKSLETINANKQKSDINLIK